MCSNCTRIALSLPLAERVKEAVAAREELRETDKKETRILIQTHPDLLVIPPDPPQLLIKIGQVRSVIQRLYRLPAEAPSSLYIFTSAGFMKEAANSLLKALEEPPEYAHILLLAENPGELLPTIRSRSSLFRLGALPPEEIEAVLQERRTGWSPRDRALVARLAEGAMGQALGFDLEGYLKSRQDALVFLHNAIGGTGSRSGDPDFASLFRVTETYRAGAEGQEKMTGLLGALRSLLEDVLLIFSGARAVGSQYRPYGGTHANLGECEHGLDRDNRPRAGRSGTGHAPQSLALARSRLSGDRHDPGMSSQCQHCPRTNGIESVPRASSIAHRCQEKRRMSGNMHPTE